jgi:hypothetical protein
MLGTVSVLPMSWLRPRRVPSNEYWTAQPITHPAAEREPQLNVSRIAAFRNPSNRRRLSHVPTNTTSARLAV